MSTVHIHATSENQSLKRFNSHHSRLRTQHRQRQPKRREASTLKYTERQKRSPKHTAAVETVPTEPRPIAPQPMTSPPPETFPPLRARARHHPPSAKAADRAAGTSR